MRRAGRSLFDISDLPPGLLTRDDSLAIGQQAQAYQTGLDGALSISSYSSASTEFARNEILRGQDATRRSIDFAEQVEHRFASVSTDRLDSWPRRKHSLAPCPLRHPRGTLLILSGRPVQ
jgi:hypothetical protein